MADRIVLNTISYHGHGAIENIVPELTARGYKKAFVTKKVTDLLDAANFAYAVYSEIKPNPTIANVQDGVAAFKAAEADCIVTIGGGSSMDTAKAIGIIINNPEFADVRSLEGVAPTKKHAVFTIAVPTTAGTAAEVTINYVITDVEKKRKFVCVDTNDIPEIAVVDPDMMASMPKGLTAATGMDALTHAIEGYITKAARAWLWASTSPAWASPTWVWASSTPWHTACPLCMTPPTAWPALSCCPSVWSTTRPSPVSAIVPSARPWV